jgi:tripartite-type tricarboxylate transporter receptor subunit TctC
MSMTAIRGLLAAALLALSISGAAMAQAPYPDRPIRLEELGLDVIGSSPTELAAVIKSETPHWAKVIKEAGIKLSE